MGKIKDTANYPLKENPIGDDYLIASDSENDGDTVNIKLSTIVNSGGSVDDDNKAVEVNFGYVVGDGIAAPDISTAINSIATPVSIAFNEYPVFTGIVYNGERSYYQTYVIQSKGKGTFGSGGTLAVSSANLIRLASTLVYRKDVIDRDPHSIVEDLGEIGATSLEDTINNLVTPIVISAGENWYFEYTVSGVEYIYGFSGAPGIYGLSQSQVLASELFLVYDQTVKVTPTKLSELTNDANYLKSTDTIDSDTLNSQSPSYYNDYNNLSNVPADFTPSAHTHTKSEISDLTANVSQFTNDAGYVTSADGGDAATVGGKAEGSLLKSDEADTKTAGDLLFVDNVLIAFGSDTDWEVGNTTVDGNIVRLNIGNLFIKDGSTLRGTIERSTGNLIMTGDVEGASIKKTGGDGTNMLLDDGTVKALNTLHGWGNYPDSRYTEGSPLSLAAATAIELPINVNSPLETYLPSDVNYFYYARRLNVTGISGTFVVGETITGGTSGATGVIKEVTASTITLNNVSDTEFVDTETVTGGTSAATATVSGAPEYGRVQGVEGNAIVITLDLKAKPTNASTSVLEVWFDIGGAVGELYRRLITFPKGINVERPVNFTTAAYTLDTWEANGAKIYIEADNTCDIYEARVVVFRNAPTF